MPAASTSKPKHRVSSGLVADTVKRHEAGSGIASPSSECSVPRVASSSFGSIAAPPPSPRSFSCLSDGPSAIGLLGNEERAKSHSEQNHPLGLSSSPLLVRRASYTFSIRPPNSQTSVHNLPSEAPCPSSSPQNLSYDVPHDRPLSRGSLDGSRRIKSLLPTPMLKKRLPPPPLRPKSSKTDSSNGHSSQRSIQIVDSNRQPNNEETSEKSTLGVYYTPASPVVPLYSLQKREINVADSTESAAGERCRGSETEEREGISGINDYLDSGQSSRNSIANTMKSSDIDQHNLGRNTGPFLLSLAQPVLPSDLSRQLSNRPNLHSRASSTSSLNVSLYSLNSNVFVPKLTRKDPGLSVTTPLTSQRISLSSSLIEAPTPPIPQKNPLRNLNRDTPFVLSSVPSSASSSKASSQEENDSSDVSVDTSVVARQESLESITAAVGTPLTPRVRKRRIEQIVNGLEANEEAMVRLGANEIRPNSSLSNSDMSHSPAVSPLLPPSSPFSQSSTFINDQMQSPSVTSTSVYRNTLNTTFTAASAYSQDSLLSTATSYAPTVPTPRSASSLQLKSEEKKEKKGRNKRRPLSGVIAAHLPWGRHSNHEKRASVDSIPNGANLEYTASRHKRSNSVPRPVVGVISNSISGRMASPDVPSNTISAANSVGGSMSEGFATDQATTGHTPISSSTNHSHTGLVPIGKSSTKSSSLPILRCYPSGASPQGDLPSPRQSDTTSACGSVAASPFLSSSPALLASSPMSLSKRQYILREIASSERAYAKDLILVRDAFVYAKSISLHSFPSMPMSRFECGDREGLKAKIGHGKRSSIYTYQTEDSRNNGFNSTSSTTSPPPKPPSDGFSAYLDYSRYGSRSRSSSISISNPQTPAQIQHTFVKTEVKKSSMLPPTGKPLSSGDIKTIFLNLEQLASLAEELANKFENALGDVGQFEEIGKQQSDRVGEVFLEMLPKIRPLYIHYCARQSQASRRLSTLLLKPSFAFYINTVWSSISPYTHAWNLDSMLIKPVQRLTKYPLLFEDLLKLTDRSHPDYFCIRRAAEEITRLAGEIDERTRRKDIVENALSKTGVGMNVNVAGGATGGGKDKKEGKLLGLKRFKKEKEKHIAGLAHRKPSKLSESSLFRLASLSARLALFSDNIPKLGQDMLLWTAAAKESLTASNGLIKCWLRVIQLDSTDTLDTRLLKMRNIVDTLVIQAWEELSENVMTSILPSLSLLLSSLSNPTFILSKRSSLMSSYTKHHQLCSSHKTPPRIVTQGAIEFIALHEQLLEDLPAFLERCTRMLDFIVVSFSRAQGKFWGQVKIKLEGFVTTWIQSPLGKGLYPGLTVGVDNSGKDTCKSDARAEETRMESKEIIAKWFKIWKDYARVLDGLESIKPYTDNKSALKPPKLELQKVSDHHSKIQLFELMPSPTLRHSASSVIFPTSLFLPSSRPGSPAFAPETTRHRSSSLHSENIGSHSLAAILASPLFTEKDKEKDSNGSGSKFSLVKRSNSKPQKGKSSHSRKNSGLCPAPLPPSATSLTTPLSGPSTSAGLVSGVGSDSVNVQFSPSEPSTISFNLPQIPNEDEGWGGLGSSPSNSSMDPPRSETNSTRAFGRHKFEILAMQSSDASTAINKQKEGERNYINVTPFPYTSSKVDLSCSEVCLNSVSNSDIPSMSLASLRNDGIPSPQFGAHPSLHTRRLCQTAKNANDAVVVTEGKMPRGGGKVAEGWKNESLLYQCACVANFDPSRLGNKQYRGLWFLPMVCGDLIDVFYEVGRIGNLRSFPYPTLGIDNDGVLVGRSENGDIGLVICSFLEPLRD
ncbi:uncharacterized protein L203_101216 [Cryptococcus depauperatus CBS 7841]|uniref:DH domain-containing protein n=1 Tax=Cryptococcus depauperatus CBS 7841 TaxID=1295531 RepID=A0AAJ8JPK6_9TREE